MQSSPEYKLQQVTVLCPVTQLPLPTGIHLNAVTFATSVFANVRVQCPHCEGEHRWGSADAFLVELEGGIPPLDSFGRRNQTPAPKKPPTPPADTPS